MQLDSPEQRDLDHRRWWRQRIWQRNRDTQYCGERDHDDADRDGDHRGQDLHRDTGRGRLQLQLVLGVDEYSDDGRIGKHIGDDRVWLRLDSPEQRDLDQCREWRQRIGQRDRDTQCCREHCDDRADRYGDHRGPDLHSDSGRRQLRVQLVLNVAEHPGNRRICGHVRDNDERVRMDCREQRGLDYLSERQWWKRQRNRHLGCSGEHHAGRPNRNGDHCGSNVHCDSEWTLCLQLDADFGECAGDWRVGKHICDGRRRLRLDSRERCELDYGHERRERQRERCSCLRYGAQHSERVTDRHDHRGRTDGLRHSGWRAREAHCAEKSEDRELIESWVRSKKGSDPFLDRTAVTST